jgi:hypothetical protein
MHRDLSRLGAQPLALGGESGEGVRGRLHPVVVQLVVGDTENYGRHGEKL